MQVSTHIPKSTQHTSCLSYKCIQKTLARVWKTLNSPIGPASTELQTRHTQFFRYKFLPASLLTLVLLKLAQSSKDPINSSAFIAAISIFSIATTGFFYQIYLQYKKN